MTILPSTLADNPKFLAALALLAKGLRGIYDEGPRLARTLASHQRWLLSQAGYALHLEYDPEKSATGLTVGRLKDLITRTGAASRNTVQNFIEEMLSYRHVRYVQATNARRSRRLEATETTDVAMLRWFSANLAALDYVDGGNRIGMLQANPMAFRLAQPRAARACLDNPVWREPPTRVAIFLWTEAGGLVMDELIARVDPALEKDGLFNIGRIDTRAMAEHFMMSRTHLQRLFKKAADLGCIGWYDERKGGNMWFSRDFLMEYCAWQAIKFSIVDEAFAWALNTLTQDTELSVVSDDYGALRAS